MFLKAAAAEVGVYTTIVVHVLAIRGIGLACELELAHAVSDKKGTGAGTGADVDSLVFVL